MFEKLYSRSHAAKWHREGPLARERDAYLESLSRQGVPWKTLTAHACYSLSLAKAIRGRWPDDHRFTLAELEQLADSHARAQVKKGRTLKTEVSRRSFLRASLGFLKFAGRLVPPPAPPAERYAEEIEDFMRACCREHGLSPSTEKMRRRDILRFLRYLEGRGERLSDVTAEHVDLFIRHLGQRWGRVSLKTVASTLRVWFRHAESRGWARRGLADALLAPRIYQQEGLPLGPTWEEVARVAEDLEQQTRKFLRDRAAILLLAVYALRSEEVRRLRIEDIDWERKRLRVVRYKSRREEVRPLEPGVAKALEAYLGHGRPECSRPEVFVTCRAPYRPLSGAGLSNFVRRHFDRVVHSVKRVGAHALRHACARHLQSEGFSLKEIGDHLSHRLPQTTQVYAKVDVDSLREVAMDDLGEVI
jgi:integrase/recombinase XerD